MVVVDEFPVTIKGSTFTAEVVVPARIDTTYKQWEILDDFEIISIKKESDSVEEDEIYNYICNHYLDYFRSQVLSKYGIEEV